MASRPMLPLQAVELQAHLSWLSRGLRDQALAGSVAKALAAVRKLTGKPPWTSRRQRREICDQRAALTVLQWAVALAQVLSERLGAADCALVLRCRATAPASTEATRVLAAPPPAGAEVVRCDEEVDASSYCRGATCGLLDQIPCRCLYRRCDLLRRC